MKEKTVDFNRRGYYTGFMSRELIEQAISISGSQAKLADACGVKQSSIWQAKDAGRASAELALLIERATAGEVSARALRPDLPWPVSEESASAQVA